MVDGSANGAHNADSWKVLSALCARRLRRRALTEDDPVCIHSSPFILQNFLPTIPLIHILFLDGILPRQATIVPIATQLLQEQGRPEASRSHQRHKVCTQR
jgi:hypothetical protein